MFVKLCGMNTEAAVAAALEAGADALGFVFAPSIRRVSPAEARRLATPARGRACCVAVMLHPTAAEVSEVMQEFVPDALQTDLADEAALSLEAKRRWWPVLRSGQALPESLPSRVLFEGPVSGAGEAADWTRARSLASTTQLILAGGLHSGNVATAIRAVQPFGVDVSSGIESEPGRKCATRIQEFVRAARAAAAENPA
ncbi:MAG: phosphoribosylanthranilate isomerase [Sinobacteraceae bacterium]|nr:phosphoribosylanthranilate isomerase [Nevskiaceae bacterium]